MKTRLMSTLLLSFIFSAMFAQNDPSQLEKLDKVWEVTGLSVPEAVLPLPQKGILLVSNIGVKNPTEKEGKGFISILTMEGEIKNLKWCDNLNSPKGMAIYGDKLYVSEVNRIAEIDLKTGKKSNEFPVEGAVFLNDIAADTDGSLYITDSRTGTIYKIKNGKVSTFIQSDDFPNPNGVVFNEGKLLLGTGEKIVKIDPATKKVEDYLLNTGGVDGIAVVEPNVLIFSDWPGKVHIMKLGEEKVLLLDTSASETRKTADFGYFAKERLIYIPTFFDNSVVCYKLKLK